MKKVSFTVSNFRRMMEEQNYYIDKSMFISHVLRGQLPATKVAGLSRAGLRLASVHTY